MATPQAQESTAVPETPASEYDAMASVFAELTTPDSSKSVEKPAAPESATDRAAAEAKEPEGGDAKPTDTTGGGDGAVGDGDTSAAAEPAAGGATPPAAEDAKPAEKDYRTLYEELLAKNEDKTPAPAAPEPKPADKPAAAPEIYDEDEKKFLVTYGEEWPDVVKGESLRRRAEYRQLVTHMFNEVARVYGPLLEQGVNAAEVVAEQATLDFVRSVHNDFDDSMYNDITAWADTLTGFRQKLVKETIENGEPGDVVDLITEYKVAKGIKAKPALTAAPASNVTPLSEAAKKAAKAMEAVDTKRTNTSANAPDPNDFDGTWAELMAGVK